MKFHCLFEQSGTFKNEFKKLGYEAYDYDILNDFSQTEYVVDLFNEIETAYEGGCSIFDNIKGNDQTIAFFPCVRFPGQILIEFRGQQFGYEKWSDEQKLEYNIKLHKELHKNYLLISKLVIVFLKKRIPLIIENPYSSRHYLQRYWCLKPKVIDYGRSER